MYVCVCNAVTERDIERAALLGCKDLAELSTRTGCGSGCGCCRELAGQILDAAIERAQAPLERAA